MDLLNNNNIQNNSDSKNQILNQWALFAQMADSNSNRRSNTNVFFITIHIAILGFSNINKLISLIIGVLLICSWITIIGSYKKQNEDKYIIINELEKELPCAPYGYEYYLKNQRQGIKKYYSFTVIELCIPIIMIIPYIANLFI